MSKKLANISIVFAFYYQTMKGLPILWYNDANGYVSFESEWERRKLFYSKEEALFVIKKARRTCEFFDEAKRFTLVKITRKRYVS